MVRVRDNATTYFRGIVFKSLGLDCSNIFIPFGKFGFEGVEGPDQVITSADVGLFGSIGGRETQCKD